MSERTQRTLLALAMLASSNAMAAEPAAELGDPTRPSYVVENKAPNAPRKAAWEVESIIVSPGRRVAVINGRTVSVDDWIGGARVREILPYEVRLEHKGEIRTITLIPTRVKNPATEW